jgi:hypothetical protein
MNPSSIEIKFIRNISRLGLDVRAATLGQIPDFDRVTFLWPVDCWAGGDMPDS